MEALIDVGSLHRRIDAGEQLALLDVRWRLMGPPARADYDEGHIPGAVFVDLERDLADMPGARGRHPLPAAEAFQTAMRGCGVSDDVPVVCYDFADSTSAARAWWLLRYFGHRDVGVLDGGFAAWHAAGGPTSSETPSPAPGDFRARPGGMSLIDADQALAVAAEGVLLDARSPERFRGETEPIDPIAGRIPGAVSAPNAGNVRENGTLLSALELQERFAVLGVTTDGPVAAYCGSGITASQHVLALEVAGFDAALYAESWSGWITDPDRPVATGPE